MKSRLLAFFGTSLLCACLAAAGIWVADVVHNQPALPALTSQIVSGKTLTGASRSAPSVRFARPDVFYSALVARPLFAPTRRPVAPAEEVIVEENEPAPLPSPESNPPPPPQLGLLGVMDMGGESRALVSNADGDPVWVREGANISGWTITALGVDWLELTLETETIRIEMYQ